MPFSIKTGIVPLHLRHDSARNTLHGIGATSTPLTTPTASVTSVTSHMLNTRGIRLPSAKHSRQVGDTSAMMLQDIRESTGQSLISSW